MIISSILTVVLGVIVVIVVYEARQVNPPQQNAVIPASLPAVQKPVYRTVINSPSTLVYDTNGSNFFTYTSYHLGLQFHSQQIYQAIDTRYCDSKLPTCGALVSGPTDPPVEKGNTITFAGFGLQVFDKNPVDMIDATIVANVLTPNNSKNCHVIVHSESSDGTVRATLDDTTGNDCPPGYVGNANGHHFFIYPKYPNALFFTEGQSFTPALFNHKNTWIDGIQLLEK